MKKDINKLFKVTLYFSIGVTGILMYFGKELGNIFFNNPNVGWYIKILAPLITLIYLDNVIDNILKGLGKQVSVMICNIFDMVISISFIYFLLPNLDSSIGMRSTPEASTNNHLVLC
jgi:stage V sporulation protein B